MIYTNPLLLTILTGYLFGYQGIHLQYNPRRSEILWKKGEIWCLIWHTEIEGCGKGSLTCISRSVSRLQWSFPAPYVFMDNRYSCIDVVIFFFRYHHGLLVSSRVIFAVTICISRLFRSRRFAYSYYETLMNHETPNYRIVKREIIRNSGKCQNILGHKISLWFFSE